MAAMIAADNVLPSFHTRRSITAADLKQLQEPALIFEGQRRDSDGELMWLYTVAGWLGGENIATMQGGCTVGGEVIIIHARNREEADMIGGLGLQDTITALHGEDDQIAAALAAQARLASIGAIERINQASKPDSQKNEAFVEDASKLRQLAGDDVVLGVGRVSN